MAEKKIKQFTCRNGHILGFIRLNGNGLPQLRVLRRALDMGAEHPDEVDLLGPLNGQMSIRCSICDDVQVWKVSTESLVALLIQKNNKTIFDVAERLVELSRKVLDEDDSSNSAPSPLRASPTSSISKSEMGEEKREVRNASV